MLSLKPLKSECITIIEDNNCYIKLLKVQEKLFENNIWVMKIWAKVDYNVKNFLVFNKRFENKLLNM